MSVYHTTLPAFYEELQRRIDERLQGQEQAALSPAAGDEYPRASQAWERYDPANADPTLASFHDAPPNGDSEQGDGK